MNWKDGKSRFVAKKKYRMIAEKVLGRALPKDAVVHHVDGNFLNNKHKNLVICENNGYHLFLHRRGRSFNACGNSSWLKCKYCKEYDDTKNLYIRSDNKAFHRKCHAEYRMLLYYSKHLQAEV